MQGLDGEYDPNVIAGQVKTQWLVERERAGDQHQAADPWVLVA
ncbi:hypothetical protein FOQG_05078 [Fusarium oxysporum f. sp. raphani 54005]|uniref:Uncharacterized protein n=4 Tax=Fusarium oxysporum TaxID=5507 RepID=X0CRH8_FUSOX|nr:hypothetical protein FOVG_01673 [Fusarium oxysporum f. sp. pisi HDV247]EXK93918.1 hypothetical protein FOQG_05078 [Fusarium oxysporum f. sp. raphani 54005]EXL87561.1 hypothetical protein FOPG_01235 [Fusarium oxysporum f. sp. conglutinans race 2 54008]EXM29388.1 hypothetical protein FOTG_05521 [Fusarium oxysporum f. sp. vasinfectum 25433]